MHTKPKKNPKSENNDENTTDFWKNKALQNLKKNLEKKTNTSK